MRYTHYTRTVLRKGPSKGIYLDESALKKGAGFEKLRATIEKVYHELLWMREHRPTCFAGPRGYPFGKSAADRRAGWEEIKQANVRFTAERYGIPLPGDLSDTAAIDKLRNEMEHNWDGPSWLRSSAWMKLANAMLRTVFDRVGVKLPHDAFVQHYMGWRHMPESWQERFRKGM